MIRAAVESRRPQLEPAELAAQDQRLGDDAGQRGDRGRGDDPADPERLVEGERGERGDDEVSRPARSAPRAAGG